MFYLLNAIFFAAAGLVVAGLLSAQQLDLTSVERLCGGHTGCAAALSSPYAKLLGIPNAFIGLAYYTLMLLGLLLALALRPSTARKSLMRLLFAASILALLAAAALTAIQLFVIHAFCPYCLLSALFSLLICLWTALALKRGDWEPRPGGAVTLTIAFSATLLLVGSLLAGRGAISPPENLASVDGTLLTAASMRAEFNSPLPGLEAQLYQTKRDWIERAIDATLIRQEATRRGIEPPDLLRTEIDDKVKESIQTLRTWMEKNKPAAGVEAEDAWYQTLAKAEDELTRRRRDEWLHSLRQGHQIRILLPKPAETPLEYDRALAHELGPPDATLKFVVFSDFQCPYCAEMDATLQKALEKYPFEVSVAWLHFPLDVHEHALDAAIAAEAAAEQGKFWLYHDRLMRQHGDLEPTWDQYARDAGLDLPRFQASLKSPSARQRVEKSKRDAAKLGLEPATPQVFLNGRRIGGLLTPDELQTLIDLQRRQVHSAPPTDNNEKKS